MGRMKSNSGFSTAEMLLATMILGLSMTLLANGAAVIQSIYRRMLATADAQMILSQAETRLRNDLSRAETPKNEGIVTNYYIRSNDALTKCTLTVRPDRTEYSEKDYPDYVLYAQYVTNEVSKLDQLSLKNVRRLEDLQIPEAPVIKFDDNCFKVYGLRVRYQDKRTGNWETLCGSSDDSKPQFVIRALQPVTTGE